MAAFVEDLIVIEASGKLKRLYAVLSALGMRARCIATLGNLLQSPPQLRPVSIQKDPAGGYLEAIRIPARPDAYDRVSSEIRALRGRLFIATDYDQEGHAIAADVVALAKQLRPDLAPLRLQLTELSPAALSASFAGVREYDPSLALSGTARRIVDRVIASAYSLPSAGVLVGRVTSAIAAMARRGLVPTHEAVLQIPCSSGGVPFTARTTVIGESRLQELQSAASQVVSLAVTSTEVSTLGQGVCYTDFLAGMNEHMGLAEAARLLQDLYEQGVVSYPRTESRGYGARGHARCNEFARSHGARLGPTAASVLPEGAHEALHIVDPRVLAAVDVMKPARLQSNHQAIALSWLSRSMAESVWQVRRDLPDLNQLPAALRGLDWSRDLGAMPAWHRRPKASSRVLNHQSAILAGLQEQRIGRPSTVVGHVVRAQERALVTPGGGEGPGGTRVLARAPLGLQEPTSAHRIETACQRAGDIGLGLAVEQALSIAAGDAAQLASLLTTIDDWTPDDDFTPSYAP